MEKGYVKSLDDMKAYYCEYYCEWLEANRKDGISNLRSKEEALIREVKEETGLTLHSYIYHAKLLFINDEYQEIMHLYTSDDFTGELIDCDEGQLVWIKEEDVLKVPHWEGDQQFLTKMLHQKEYFEMTLYYKNDQLVKVINEIKNGF